MPCTSYLISEDYPFSKIPNLKPPGVDLDDPGELAQPQDFAVGEVADADLPWVYTGYIG